MQTKPCNYFRTVTSSSHALRERDLNISLNVHIIFKLWIVITESDRWGNHPSEYMSRFSCHHMVLQWSWPLLVEPKLVKNPALSSFLPAPHNRWNQPKFCDSVFWFRLEGNVATCFEDIFLCSHIILNVDTCPLSKFCVQPEIKCSYRFLMVMKGLQLELLVDKNR